MNELDHLVCDCHLQWLARFINSTLSNRPLLNLNVRGSTCFDQGGLDITDPSVNFGGMCTGIHTCIDLELNQKSDLYCTNFNE